MRVALAADHGGYDLKEALASWLQAQGHDVADMGAPTCEAGDDYPDYAAPAAEAVASGKAGRAIILCGSGVGACVVANKVPGVRACVCHDTYSAHQGVEHDDMNVLCLGARIIGIELAREVVGAFLKATFAKQEERFCRRLAKLEAVEARYQRSNR